MVLKSRLVAFVSFVLVAALPGPPAALAADAPVIVFAAASLKNALDDAAAAWQRETGQSAKMSYAASSTLAKQMEQDAPAQIFMSADEDWMDYVAAKGLIKRESRSDLLGNKLVLIAPKDSKIVLALKTGADIAKALGGGRLAMANVD